MDEKDAAKIPQVTAALAVLRVKGRMPSHCQAGTATIQFSYADGSDTNALASEIIGFYTPQSVQSVYEPSQAQLILRFPEKEASRLYGDLRKHVQAADPAQLTSVINTVRDAREKHSECMRQAGADVKTCTTELTATVAAANESRGR